MDHAINCASVDNRVPVHVPRYHRGLQCRMKYALLLFLCTNSPLPCLHLIPRPSSHGCEGGTGSFFVLAQQALPVHTEGRLLLRVPLRGGTGRLRSSAIVNFLTGETVDEVTFADVDSDDDMTGATPVDWLPRSNFLLPEERRKLSYCDMRAEPGELQFPLSRGSKRSKKASGFLLWRAKLTARYTAARARLDESAAQVMLDMANKYSCGLGEHWARHVLAGRKGRRRREKREAAKLDMSGCKGQVESDSPSCLPLDCNIGTVKTFGKALIARLISLPTGRGAGARHMMGHKQGERTGAADDKDDDEFDLISLDSMDLSLDDSSSSHLEESLHKEVEESWEENSGPWLAANVTRPSKNEVHCLTQRVEQLAEESGDSMPEITALRRQCVRLSKVCMCMNSCD